MPFGNQELTDTGVSYLAQAQLGEQLRVIRMVAGKGVAANLPDDLWPLTALIDYVMDMPIIASTYVTPDTIRITGTLSSLNVPSGGSFEFNEVGLMCECGTLVEALYSVDNTGGGGDTIPDMDSPAPVVQTIDLYIKISRATNITINVVPGGIYEATNRGDPLLGPGPYIEKVGDILHFKRFVAGAGIEILDDALTPPETITIQQKILEVDLDLFVDIGAPDVFPNFSTLQNALDYLIDFFIPANIFSNIKIGPGVWSSAKRIDINHPNASQIRISGTMGVSKIPTGVVSVANNPVITHTGPAGMFSDMVVGDFFFYDAVSRMGSGLWPITAVAADGSSITFQIAYGDQGAATVGGETLYPFKTVLAFDPDINGIQITSPTGLGLFENIVIQNSAGNNTNQVNGLRISGGGIATVRFSGAYGWQTASGMGGGFGSVGGHLVLENCGISVCASGVTATRSISQVTANNVIASSCQMFGFWSDGGATLSGSKLFATGNRIAGFSALNRGTLIVNGSSAQYSDFGINCTSMGYMVFQSQNSQANNFYSNRVFDIRILDLSAIIQNGPTAMGFGTTNWLAAAGLQISADGCLLKTGATLLRDGIEVPID